MRTGKQVRKYKLEVHDYGTFESLWLGRLRLRRVRQARRLQYGLRRVRQAGGEARRLRHCLRRRRQVTAGPR